MPNCIPLQKALALSIGLLKQPVVTKYQLGGLVFKLYQTGEFQGTPLCTRKTSPASRDFTAALAGLVDSGVLTPARGLPAKSVFNILGKGDAPPSEVACTIDPFAYLSHLSAMEFHGLTDRLPKILYISTPAPAKWREFAQDKMSKDWGEDLPAYRAAGFPPLQKISVSKIGKRPVHIHSGTHLGAFKTIKDRPLRVATIGRTFLDMLRQPDLCGGIRHVVDVFREHASTYIELIVAEVDAHGQPIDKVRAGYILEELCSLENPAVEQWRLFVQRGGSRKLDPSSEYSPHYSERWCLSINIDEA